MDRNLNLENSLRASLAEFATEITAGETAYRLVAKVPEKEITITWPYPLMEVFFDFSGPGEKSFSESVEFYDGETSEEQTQYIGYVVKRFLKLPIRIHTKKGWPSITELQVEEKGDWQCVFE